MNVLVLCLANRYRSPLVAAALKTALGHGHDVVSAGFKPGGALAGKSVRDYAGLKGWNLSHHYSREVTAIMVNRAHVVVLMNRKHLRLLNERFGAPPEGQRRLLLGDFADPVLKGIPDPAFIPAGSPAFLAVADGMVGAARKLAAFLVSVRAGKCQ